MTRRSAAAKALVEQRASCPPWSRSPLPGWRRSSKNLDDPTIGRTGSALPSGYACYEAAHPLGRGQRPPDPARRDSPGYRGIRVGGRASAAASAWQHLPRRDLPPGRRRRAGVVRGQPRRPAGPGRDAGAVPARMRRPRPGKQEASVHCPGHSGAVCGAEPDLLGEVTWWQTDDFWQYALWAAVAYIRAAASRAGVPVRRVCQDWPSAPDCSPDEPSLDAC